MTFNPLNTGKSRDPRIATEQFIHEHRGTLLGVHRATIGTAMVSPIFLLFDLNDPRAKELAIGFEGERAVADYRDYVQAGSRRNPADELYHYAMPCEAARSKLSELAKQDLANDLSPPASDSQIHAVVFTAGHSSVFEMEVEHPSENDADV
jgi:hypothetical protein